jgi:hypothetical protein
MCISSRCGHILSNTRPSSNTAIYQSTSFENFGKVLFISLTIDFSSVASFSSSLLIGGIIGTERDGETIVMFDDWDGDCDAVGDGDRDGEVVLAFVLACLVFDFMVGYFDGSFFCLPCVGLFQ